MLNPDGTPAAGLKLVGFPPYRARFGELRSNKDGKFEFTWDRRNVGGSDDQVCLSVRDLERNLSADAFKQWQHENRFPFTVTRLGDAGEKALWATGVESLPWLILTDRGRRVVTEGFALEELRGKIKP